MGLIHAIFYNPLIFDYFFLNVLSRRNPIVVKTFKIVRMIAMAVARAFPTTIAIIAITIVRKKGVLKERLLFYFFSIVTQVAIFRQMERYRLVVGARHEDRQNSTTSVPPRYWSANGGNWATRSSDWGRALKFF